MVSLRIRARPENTAVETNLNSKRCARTTKDDYHTYKRLFMPRETQLVKTSAQSLSIFSLLNACEDVPLGDSSGACSFSELFLRPMKTANFHVEAGLSSSSHFFHSSCVKATSFDSKKGHNRSRNQMISSRDMYACMSMFWLYKYC